MSDTLAMVQQLAAEVAALRATIPRPTDAEFASRLEELLRTERDPDLHDAIWSFKEGKLDRSGILSHPAYGRVTARRVAAAFDAMSPEETAELHETIEALKDERRHAADSDESAP